MLIIAKAETLAILPQALIEKTVTKTDGKEHVKEVITEEKLKLGLRGCKLHNTDGIIGIFNKSDPFFRLHRFEQDGSQTKIFESEHVKNTTKPKWKEIIVPVPSLVEPSRGSFSLEVWDD
jgi:hypothetical protein